jgi:hypothetical protein
VALGILWPLLLAALYMLVAVLIASEPVRVPLLVYSIVVLWIALVPAVLGAFLVASLVGLLVLPRAIRVVRPRAPLFLDKRDDGAGRGRLSDPRMTATMKRSDQKPPGVSGLGSSRSMSDIWDGSCGSG